MNYLFCSIFFVFLFSCVPSREQLLLGSWDAVRFNGEEVSEGMKMIFKANGEVDMVMGGIVEVSNWDLVKNKDILIFNEADTIPIHALNKHNLDIGPNQELAHFERGGLGEKSARQIQVAKKILGEWRLLRAIQEELGEINYELIFIFRSNGIFEQKTEGLKTMGNWAIFGSSDSLELRLSFHGHTDLIPMELLAKDTLILEQSGGDYLFFKEKSLQTNSNRKLKKKLQGDWEIISERGDELLPSQWFAFKRDGLLIAYERNLEIKQGIWSISADGKNLIIEDDAGREESTIILCEGDKLLLKLETGQEIGLRRVKNPLKLDK